MPTFRFPERLALVRACAHALRACAHMMRACAQPCARMRAAMHACMHSVLKEFGPSLLSWSSWSSSSSWPSLLSWPPCRGQEHYLAVACRSPKWAASTNGWANNLEACQSMDMFRTKSENFRDNPRRCWEAYPETIRFFIQKVCKQSFVISIAQTKLRHSPICSGHFPGNFSEPRAIKQHLGNENMHLSLLSNE